MKKIILILIAAQLFLACEKMSVKNSSDNNPNGLDPIVGIWRDTKSISSQTETAEIERHIQCFSIRKVNRYAVELDQYWVFQTNNKGYLSTKTVDLKQKVKLAIEWQALSNNNYSIKVFRHINDGGTLIIEGTLENSKEFKTNSKENKILGCDNQTINIKGTIIEYLGKEK